MHPECPERLISIRERMMQEGLWDDVVTPVPATMSDLLLNHSKEYILSVKNSPEGYLDPDTYLRKETYDIALAAVGGGIQAASVAFHERRPVFALLRPPGHHALKDSSMGFCYFNNVAIAAKKLLAHAGRIAIVDVDVHHGNGTQDSFYHSADVLYISIHQRNIFPGTGHWSEVGRDEGEGYTVNIPLRGGSGDRAFRLAMEGVISPVLENFAPSLILVSLGADAHAKDPLAGLSLSSRGYLELMYLLHQKSKELCSGRFAVFLEGGYALGPLSEVVVGSYAQTRGRNIELDTHQTPESSNIGRDIGTDEVLSAKKMMDQYWKL